MMTHLNLLLSMSLKFLKAIPFILLWTSCVDPQTKSVNQLLECDVQGIVDSLSNTKSVEYYVSRTEKSLHNNMHSVLFNFPEGDSAVKYIININCFVSSKLLYHGGIQSGITTAFNTDGSIWTETYFENGIPKGDVYCMNEFGDTVQYYFHNPLYEGEVSFTALLDTLSHSFSTTGNPIYKVGLSDTLVQNESSFTVAPKFANPQWALKSFYLEEVEHNGRAASILSNNDFYNLVFSVVPHHTGILNLKFHYLLIEKKSKKHHNFSRDIRVRVMGQ